MLSVQHLFNNYIVFLFNTCKKDTNVPHPGLEHFLPAELNS